MKFPLDWHREGLRNAERYLADKEAEIARLQADADRLRESVAFSRSQIGQAMRRGLDGYDADRFLVVRRKTA